MWSVVFTGLQIFPNKMEWCASMEKAILDYLYLHSEIKSVSDFQALRWNIEGLRKMNIQKMDDYLSLFNKKTLSQRYLLLKKYNFDWTWFEKVCYIIPFNYIQSEGIVHIFALKYNFRTALKYSFHTALTYRITTN